MKSLREIFPKASPSFFEANAAVLTPPASENDSDAILATPRPRRTKMNNTEKEFAMMLEAMLRRGDCDFDSYLFEGITLRWPCGKKTITYTPDFVVRYSPLKMRAPKLIEVKGPFIRGNRERAVERFRHALTYWEKDFSFELHQKTKHQGWTRLL